MERNKNLEKTEGNKDLAFVRQRITPNELLKTTPEIFEREADEFAKFMLEHFSMDIIKKCCSFRK